MERLPKRSRARQFAATLGGLLFAASLLYFGVMYANRFGENAAPGTSIAAAVLVNVLLFAAFGAHHSVFARAGIKSRVRAVVPGLDRTVYVVIASILFGVMTAFWQLVPGTLWRVEGVAAWLLYSVQLSGFVLAFAAGRLVDPLELAGVRPAVPPPAGSPFAPVHAGPYRFIRHPLYLAILLAVWATPVMTMTRLLVAVLSTAYVVIAIPLEERDLRNHFGASYDTFARTVRYRLVPGLY